MAIGATQAQVLASVARSAATLIGTGTNSRPGGGFGGRPIVGANSLWREAHRSGDLSRLSSLMMLGIGAAATFLPARRATRIDPMQALRQE